MPGPDGPWGDALVAAVRCRRGRRGGRRPQGAAHPAARRAGSARWRVRPAAPRRRRGRRSFAREAASRDRAGQNRRRACRWTPPRWRVAVIGHNARECPHPGRRQRHGAARGDRLAAGRHPRRAARTEVSLRARRRRAGRRRRAAAGPDDQPRDRRARAACPRSSTPTAPISSGGPPLERALWFGGDAPIGGRFPLHTDFTPDATGQSGWARPPWAGRRLHVDGAPGPRARSRRTADIGDLSSPRRQRPWSLPCRRRPIDILGTGHRCRPAPGRPDRHRRHRAGRHRPRAVIAEAAEAAREADVAVVVVGTNSSVESEGYRPQHRTPRPPGRPGPRGRRGEPAHRRGRQLRLAGRHAVAHEVAVP